MFTLFPSLSVIIQGTFKDPHPLCLATALDIYPLSPDTFSVADDEHVPEVSTEKHVVVCVF